MCFNMYEDISRARDKTLFLLCVNMLYKIIHFLV